jgi:hypothetical protein
MNPNEIVRGVDWNHLPQHSTPAGAGVKAARSRSDALSSLRAGKDGESEV